MSIRASVWLALPVAFALACGGPSTPAEEPFGDDPHPRPFVVHPGRGDFAEMDAASLLTLRTESATFRSVQARAYRVGPIEVLGVVDSAGSFVQCEPEPCDPAWEKLERPMGGRALVVRKSGKLALLIDERFASDFGAIDTPEKAVLRVSVSSENLPAICADFGSFGGKCAEGTDPSGTPVRATDDGFDVVAFGARAVCREHAFGDHQQAFTVVHVTKTGEVSPIAESPIGALTAGYADRHAQCAPAH